MYLIIGLGNPEKEYSNTRHNMGFDTINKLAKQYDIEVNKNKFQGLYQDVLIEGQKVKLLKPQTFMNLSGECIREYIQFFKIDMEDVIIIYDDMDIESGNIKIRKKGNAGGHNGIKSVIENLGTNEFNRIRIGIGKPQEKYNQIDYVIGKVSEEEMEKLQEGTEKAKEAIIEIIKNGIDSAMNKFN